jgi:predicted RNase H-like HicB family nuclease
MSETAMPRIRYSMVIEWSDEDNAFIVTVPELVGCRTHGSTYAEAVANGWDVLDMFVRAATGIGEYLPPPNKFVYQWWSDEQIAAQGMRLNRGDDEDMLPYQQHDADNLDAAEQKWREQGAKAKRDWREGKS